ncbi:MAG: hypothetical protein H0X37_05500 [Herpetosiphonaceae bacterium]|nr:hypothetical protein [Herpetosiphonaceae bacterium]
MHPWTLRLTLVILILLPLCGCAADAAPTQAGQLMTTSTSNQPSQTGTLSICQETDGGLTGTWSFNSSVFTQTQTITVVAGATQPVCGPLLHVPAGTVSATEETTLGTTLASARTFPTDSLIRLTGSTATFTVAADSLDAQTLIIFHNSPPAK